VRDIDDLPLDHTDEPDFAPLAGESLNCTETPGLSTSGATLSLAVRGREGTIVEAVRRLDQAGVAVKDLGLRRPTLDDVFLSLTGHVAEATDDAEETA